MQHKSIILRQSKEFGKSKGCCTQTVIDCYDDACAVYKKSVEACNGDQFCLDLAGAAYHNSLAQCHLAMETTSDQLVVWFDGEGWVIAWPGEEFTAGSMQFAFNL